MMCSQWKHGYCIQRAALVCTICWLFVKEEN